MAEIVEWQIVTNTSSLGFTPWWEYSKKKVSLQFVK